MAPRGVGLTRTLLWAAETPAVRLSPTRSGIRSIDITSATTVQMDQARGEEDGVERGLKRGSKGVVSGLKAG